MTVTGERELLAGIPDQLLVDGKWVPAARTGSLAVEDPATGEVIAEVADADVADGLVALDAAVAAQAEWAAVAPRVRGEILRRAYAEVVRRTDELALLMTLEMGKPLAESRGEVAYGAEFFRWFAEEAVRVEGGYQVPPGGGSRILTTRQPVGPSLLVTPWNFPLAMGTRKIGPAIAAGCTMVVKPAETTPLTMLLLGQILLDCGLPPGVLNIVTTSTPGPVVGALMADGRARKVSFTGSTEVGVRLLRQAAQHVMRSSMELGGHAPFVVFADADLDVAVDGAMLAKMRNMGEACTAASRFLVAEEVAEEFACRLTHRMGALRVGRGTEPGVDVGPLIDEASRDKVAALVADAQDRGARTLTGGNALSGRGHFFAPTVLTDVPADARVMREEVFGPVAPVVSFATEDEAVTLANDSPFGLAGYLFTRDLSRALRVLEAMQVGMVGVNRGLVSDPAAPFGGVKMSGLGREGGRLGIEEFLQTKYAAVAL